MCVETLRTGLDLSEMNDFRGHMPRFTLNMNVVLIYLPQKPHKCVLKPPEQGSIFLK